MIIDPSRTSGDAKDGNLCNNQPHSQYGAANDQEIKTDLHSVGRAYELLYLCLLMTVAFEPLVTIFRHMLDTN